METQRALALDPLPLIINAELGWAYYWSRQYDRAIEQFHKTVEMDSNFSFVYWGLAQAYIETQRHAEAIASLEQAVALSRDWPVIVAELGYAYARSGNKAKAQQILAQLQERLAKEYIDPVLLANIYIALDKKDRAFEWLEKGYAQRACVWMIWLKIEPKYDPLRSDPRFTALLQKMGLEK